MSDYRSDMLGKIDLGDGRSISVHYCYDPDGTKRGIGIAIGQDDEMKEAALLEGAEAIWVQDWIGQAISRVSESSADALTWLGTPEG